MKVIEEFKTFALRGNMIELAVGFTVGAAFTSFAATRMKCKECDRTIEIV